MRKTPCGDVPRQDSTDSIGPPPRTRSVGIRASKQANDDHACAADRCQSGMVAPLPPGEAIDPSGLSVDVHRLVHLEDGWPARQASPRRGAPPAESRRAGPGGSTTSLNFASCNA